MEMNVFNLPLKIIKFLKKSIEQADNQKKSGLSSAAGFLPTAVAPACSPDYGFTIEKEPSKVQKFSGGYPDFSTFRR